MTPDLKWAVYHDIGGPGSPTWDELNNADSCEAAFMMADCQYGIGDYWEPSKTDMKARVWEFRVGVVLWHADST